MSSVLKMCILGGGGGGSGKSVLLFSSSLFSFSFIPFF